ncbi:glycoside hydrolase family protein [Massilia sp. 9096]|uniref:glycoside hydrolase family protein n=1 Tax=Massilia sp. 9096 TaxID=1500894 RepID=UPI0009DF1B4F|nr:glycoside hydrolase family protein [Massilia sp. 9096]
MTSSTTSTRLARRRFLTLLASSAAAGGLAACGAGATGGGAVNASSLKGVAPTPAASAAATAAVSKSVKRGIAYDLASAADFKALAPGVSWWYNWAAKPNAAAPVDALTQYGMDYFPMLWNDNFDAAAITAYIQAHGVKYLLLLNEPNLTDQASMTPQKAAQLWPRYEAIAAATGVKLVGPAMNWGTLAGYSDPVTWLDAFYAAYQAANGNRAPHIDYLAFHWYDYGLASQLDRLKKYGKSIWVTEMANWHSQNDGAQIDTLARQQAQMKDMVATCEARDDVFRYAWFTGRMTSDPHFSSLLGANGQLTALGQLYLTLPFKTAR